MNDGEPIVIDGGDNGVEAFKEYFAGNFQRYPDLTVTVDHILARDDRVMVFTTWRGTFTGHTHGRAPTGKKLHMRTFATGCANGLFTRPDGHPPPSARDTKIRNDVTALMTKPARTARVIDMDRT